VEDLHRYVVTYREPRRAKNRTHPTFSYKPVEPVSSVDGGSEQAFESRRRRHYPRTAIWLRDLHFAGQTVAAILAKFRIAGVRDFASRAVHGRGIA
jgi:hypothetical protein